MCIDNCNPLRTEPPIPISLVEKVLKEVKQLHINLIHGVVITGGETSLYPDLSCDIVSLVNEYGHRCILVTNAHFATSFEAASSFLSRLKEAGLNWLGVSYDEEHSRQTIPLRIVNTLAAAHDLCFDAVYLSSVTERDNTAAFHNIIDTIREKYNIKINHAIKADCTSNELGPDRSNEIWLPMYQFNKGSPLVRVRNPAKTGHKNYWDPYQTRRPIKELLKYGWPCLQGPMVGPDGDWQLCTNTVMSGGNINDKSMEEIYARLSDNPVYRLISNHYAEGVARYVQFLDAFTGSNLFSRKYASVCELCTFVFQQYIPKLASNKEKCAIKYVPEFFPFHTELLNSIQMPDNPRLAEIEKAAVPAFRESAKAVFRANTRMTCKHSILESLQPYVQTPEAREAITKWHSKRKKRLS